MSQPSSFPNLVAKVRLRGVIETLTGLHVGGSDVGLKIGGSDKVVVKDPKTGRPYIPGSTLKGKMRALLEKAGFCCDGQGIVLANHRLRPREGVSPCRCGRCVVCQLFGVAAEEGRRSRGEGDHPEGDRAAASIPIRCVGRLIVRDALLDEACARDMESWRYLAAPFVEVKTEVSIDRLTSQANPRNFERVPAGARFAFEIVLDVCLGDDESRYLDTVRQGFRLLAADYLGGQGTRGYGAVRVCVTEVCRLDLLARGTRNFESHTPTNWTIPWAEPALPQEEERVAVPDGA